MTIAKVLFLVAMGFQGCEAAASQTVKILQFNFNDEVVPFDDRKQLMRELRFAQFVQWIQTESPDVIFIEEGFDFQGAPSLAIPLAKAVGYDQFYRIGEGFPGILYDSNVILAKKQFRMSDTHETDLPHSAFHLGDGIHDYIAFGSHSDVIGAKLTLDNGEPLFVYTTHLIGGTVQNRADQANGLLAAIEKQITANGLTPATAHVILAGDMNADPSEPAIHSYVDAGFADTWSLAHPDHVNDTLAFTNCADPRGDCYNPLTLGSGQFPAQNVATPDAQIDYIFTRGPETGVLASTLWFTHPYGGFWMSDHYGVLSTISIGPDPATPEPNPLNDGPPIAPTALLSVTDKDFASCKKNQVCDASSQPFQAGARGFTLINQASGDVSIQLKGPGTIWPKSSADLEPGQVASFVFLTPGEYAARIHGKGRRLKTVVRTFW